MPRCIFVQMQRVFLCAKAAEEKMDFSLRHFTSSYSLHFLAILLDISTVSKR